MPLEKFNLPIGRIVGGNPAIMQPKTDYHTGKEIIGQDGQPVMQSRCEIAIPKDVFLREVWPHMARIAAESYPINPATGQPSVNRDFSWKYVDGDSPECPKNSKTPYNVRPGYAGHYVLKVSTEAFQPKVFKQQNGAFYDVQPNELKTGDYVIANVDIKVHTSKDGGLYINPNGFHLVGLGEEIKSAGGINPEQAFGANTTYQLPAGAQPIGSAPMAPQMPAAMPTYATPQAPMAMPAAPMPQQAPMGYAQPPMAPAGYPQQPAYAAPAAGAPMPPPAHDFVQNVGMPQGPQPMAAPQYAAPTAMPVQPQGMPQMAMPTAMPASSSHFNGMPPMPQR